MTKNQPRVSIVTVVWNNREFVAAAIESVLAQSYPNIEYIVKDGGSTDGTLEVIGRYKDRLRLLAGKDKGLYDAMNIGLQAASGDILMHLNSDDFYASRDSIARVVQAMEETQADIAWGDMMYVDRNDPAKVVRRWKSSPYARGKFQRGWHPPHAGFAVRRRVYEQYGWFNAELRIAADYELMLRFLEKNKVSACYVPGTLVAMRTGGVSGGLLARLWRVRKEDYRAWRINGLSGGFMASLLKPLSKLQQLFR
jgi:glycosyltransferase